ncbi:methyl-accepting chemotaxis protein (divided with OB2729 and OB2730) [Oceanobacillus iheyensis HTE831]|uniref:Methyl-accepting chemotaxis protein (Divided with OB2729 and OB2730) n=2 Tax=Oceanobacillus iheyensis TaxID=182710 RepID=Q8EMW0_OCEIH|nr:hypothetical protein [Oceanobacillus iheyensis]BAC14686.1 methyl-accepting chemotaxis protein (divided with OB2729 and OB2730) [Oceanobacillus iheyensis HTE831]
MKRVFMKKGIRFKLILSLVLMLVIPGSLIGWLTYFSSSNIFENQMEDSIDESIEIIQQTTNNTL